MLYFKLKDSKKIIEVKDENTKILYERNGFIETDEKGEPIR